MGFVDGHTRLQQQVENRNKPPQCLFYLDYLLHARVVIVEDQRWRLKKANGNGSENYGLFSFIRSIPISIIYNSFGCAGIYTVILATRLHFHVY